MKNKKIKAISLFIALITIFSCVSFSAFLPVIAEVSEYVNILEYDSNPTAREFSITSAEGLMKFSSLSSKTKFKGQTIFLECDVDMTGFDYEPFYEFSGTFDGKFHAVKNIRIITFKKQTGFVGMLSAGGVIRNLGFEGGTITAKSDTHIERVGTFAGEVVSGTIENCWSTVSVKGEKYNDNSTSDISVGGIAGGLINNGIVKNSYFAGSVSGVDHVSGIADWCQGQTAGTVGKIINCFEAGTYKATTVYPLGRYNSVLPEVNKKNTIINSYYKADGVTYSFGEMKKYTSTQMGNGELAFLLDNGNSSSRTNLWKQGAYFPELCGNTGVYPLKITVKTSDGYSTVSNTYMNAGDIYTVKVGGAYSSMKSSEGEVKDGVFTMPHTCASLEITVDLPNLASVSSQRDKNAFVVTSFEGFKALSTFINGGNGTFKDKTIYMIHDIDMKNQKHTPIGVFVSESDWSKAFSGTFFGNAYKIFNLNVNEPYLNGAGLFGCSQRAVFEKIGIFSGNVSANNRAGGLTGYGDSSVFTGCYNGASVTTVGGGDGCGGIAGVSRVNSKFYYCYNFGTINATYTAAGGLSGWGQSNVATYGCFNVGKVSSSNSYTPLVRTADFYSGGFHYSYYLDNVISENGGIKKTFEGMTSRDFAYILNTLGSSSENKKIFTDTPWFPALCGENDGYARKEKITAVSSATGVVFSTLDVYGNSGDFVAVKENFNFYQKTPIILGDDTYIKIYEPSYTIKYILNGGTLKNPVSEYYSSVSTYLPTDVTKDGFVFMGWYEDSSMLTSPSVCIGKETTGNKTFYAKWGTVTEISSVSEFQNFVSVVNGGKDTSNMYVRLGNHIDLTGYNCSPLGTKNSPFKGVFDGDGYIIKGYNYTTNSDNAGLIGYLKGGIVKNVYLENTHVTGNSNVGAIVGNNLGGVVYNCGANGEVVSGSKKTDLSIMSFNIRVPVDPSPNSLGERIPRVRTFINKYSPDIIGLQEVTSEWKPELEKILSGYNGEFVYRDNNNNEAAPLYWKKSKFDCLEQGSFWLSETPDKMSVDWNSACHRTASFAVLKEKSSQKIVLAFNTHLDIAGDEVRKRELKVISERMKLLETKYTNSGYEQISMFLTGDYNATPGESSHNLVKDYLSDSRFVADTLVSPAGTNTFSGFQHWNGTGIIDYIYVDDDDMDVLTYKVCNENVYGGFVSDHFAIYVTASLTDKSVGGVVGLNKGYVVNSFFNGSVRGDFCAGGLVGDNMGHIIGGYSVPQLFTGDESGAVSGVNRGVIDGTLYVHSTAKGSYNKDTAKNTKADNLIKELSGEWKVETGVNDGYPLHKITVVGLLNSLVLKSDSSYQLKEKTLCKVKEGQSVEEVLGNFENQGLVIEGGVKTGGKVCLKKNENVLDEAVIVILGDVEGNGKVDTTDYLRIKSYFLKEFELLGVYLLAADVDESGEIDSTDYLKLKAHFLEIDNIFD